MASVVYLYLVNYGRTKADSIHHAISGFLSVSMESWHLEVAMAKLISDLLQSGL